MGTVKSYLKASTMTTTAFSNVFGCQHPASFVPGVKPPPLYNSIGGSAQADFSSKTSRVRRNPLVKKYMPVA